MDEDEFEIIAIEEADLWGGPEHLVSFHPDEEGRLIGLLPLKRLAEFNPFEISPWHDGEGVSIEGVKAAIEASRFENEPYSAVKSVYDRSWGAAKHEERIAYLVQNGSDEPIEIEFNSPDGGSTSVYDGYHRLAAAIYRNDETIRVELGGFLSGSVTALGIIIPDYQRLGKIEDYALNF